MNGYNVDVSEQEAMFIDWVLTLHSYDSEYLDYLLKPEIQELRHQAGQIVVDGGGRLELLEDEVRLLLVLLPITFRFGKEDVGYSLKKKLYEAYLGKKQIGEPEEESYASKDKAGRKAEGGTAAQGFTIPTGESLS